MRTPRFVLGAVIIGLSWVPFPARLDATNVARSAPRAQIIGVYRLTIAGTNRAVGQRVDVILERGTSGNSGYLVDETRSTVLDDLHIDAGTLRATVMTTRGRGALTVYLFVDPVRGSLSVGDQILDIRGARAL